MIVLFLILELLFAPQRQEKKVMVITHHVVKVSGYTSLGRFNCDFTRVGEKDTLNLNVPGNHPSLEFEIPISSFSCGNFLLNKDFRSTLKSSEYPCAQVEVKNLYEMKGGLFCHLTVNLVGKTLEFPEMELERKEEEIAGKLVLNFDMLDLDPPKKFGGLVKVEDKLDLEFVLGI